MNDPMGRSARTLLSLVILAAVVTAAPVAAQQQTPPATQQQREHVVKRGDTLWDLARAYLSNPFLWPSIFEANRQVVDNPHWIFPDERLLIPPVVASAPGADSTSGAQPSMQVAVAPAARPAPARPPVHTRFYQSRGPVDTVRALVLAAAQLPPYIVPPAEYRSAPWLADSAALGVVGRIVEGDDPADEGDRLPPVLHPFDRVYVGRLQGELPAAGDSLLAVRMGDEVPGFGRVIEPVAMLYVEASGGSVLTATIAREFGDARVGDMVVPVEPMPEIARGKPASVGEGAQGRLLAFEVPQSVYGTMDRGFIDLGATEGVGIGDELIAYVPARPLKRDEREELPPVEVATLRVVKVKENSATVRVVSANNTSLQDGLPVRVVRRMP